MGRCLIHDSQDLTSVEQYDLRIKALNKGNIYLLSMRSVSYIQAVVKYMHSRSYRKCFKNPPKVRIFLLSVTNVGTHLEFDLQISSIDVGNLVV